MPNRLPIPSDLQHLIEKRELNDRRQNSRRNPAALSAKPAPPSKRPTSAGEVTENDSEPTEEASRRVLSDRRKTGRRKSP
ncbi:MAG: hypothetical protein JWN70_5889 [Planctomycetaceae bacterium]|nr:hypothetical protein [Planctomycetaceae bacterium]